MAGDSSPGRSCMAIHSAAHTHLVKLAIDLSLGCMLHIDYVRDPRLASYINCMLIACTLTVYIADNTEGQAGIRAAMFRIAL